MHPETLDLLSVIGKCHRLFDELSIKTSSRAGVLAKTRCTCMPEVEGHFLYEEYFDVELKSGNSFSWCLELAITALGIEVEADVRVSHSLGQDVMETIAEASFDSAGDACTKLPEIIQKLCKYDPFEKGSRYV